jgi:hypothetical protein
MTHFCQVSMGPTSVLCPSHTSPLIHYTD